MNRQQRRQSQHKRTTLRQIHRADPTAALALLHIARPYEPGEMVDEHLITQAAYERLRDGTGTEDDFDRVSMILNVGLVRAEQVQNGELLIETIQRAQVCMQSMKARYLRGLRFGFDAAGLREVPYALEAYTQLMDASSPLQMKLAIQEAFRRISNGDLLEIPK